MNIMEKLKDFLPKIIENYPAVYELSINVQNEKELDLNFSIEGRKYHVSLKEL